MRDEVRGRRASYDRIRGRGFEQHLQPSFLQEVAEGANLKSARTGLEQLSLSVENGDSAYLDQIRVAEKSGTLKLPTRLYCLISSV